MYNHCCIHRDAVMSNSVLVTLMQKKTRALLWRQACKKESKSCEMQRLMPAEIQLSMFTHIFIDRLCHRMLLASCQTSRLTTSDVMLDVVHAVLCKAPLTAWRRSNFNNPASSGGGDSAATPNSLIILHSLNPCHFDFTTSFAALD